MRAFAALLVLLTITCSSPESKEPRVSKEPISVRGWIANLQGQEASVWVENAPYISGGVAPNGAFLLLDVPPGNLTIEFTAPGIRSSKLILENIPGNADVFVPGVVLKPESTVALLDPKLLRVRMGVRIDKPAATAARAIVAGTTVPVVNVPLNDLTDRHDFPIPPANNKSVIMVR